MMDTMADHLTTAGAQGVHLGVDEANAAGRAFYERLGFTELHRTSGARYLGRTLGARPDIRPG